MGGPWACEVLVVLASYANGTKLVAVVDGGNIYTSSDSGDTWVALASQKYWRGVASSADGTKLVAIQNWGNIRTSSDNGETWTDQGNILVSEDQDPSIMAERYWNAVACSADGTKLFAVLYGGHLYTATTS
jgi:photosystem II stability/assembly factor-like uncharacterized protein